MSGTPVVCYWRCPPPNLKLISFLRIEYVTIRYLLSGFLTSSRKGLPVGNTSFNNIWLQNTSTNIMRQINAIFEAISFLICNKYEIFLLENFLTCHSFIQWKWNESEHDAIFITMVYVLSNSGYRFWKQKGTQKKCLLGTKQWIYFKEQGLQKKLWLWKTSFSKKVPW